MVKLKKINDYCTLWKNEKSTKDAYFIHGFNSNTIPQSVTAFEFANRHPDYDVIQCDARGHGSRKKTTGRLDWNGTANDIEDIINERKRDTTLIGHSMGGFLAITIGSRNTKVKKVFAISAGNGDAESVLKNKDHLEKHFTVTKKEENQYWKSLESAMPANNEECKRSNAKKYYLIHSKNDTTVPIDQLEKNQKGLCISDNNVLIYDDNYMEKSLAHIMPFYIKRTAEFIDKKLNE